MADCAAARRNRSSGDRVVSARSQKGEAAEAEDGRGSAAKQTMRSRDGLKAIG